MQWQIHLLLYSCSWDQLWDLSEIPANCRDKNIFWPLYYWSICLTEPALTSENWAALQSGSSTLWTLTAVHMILCTFMVCFWSQWGCLPTCLTWIVIFFSISGDPWGRKCSAWLEHMLHVHRQQLEKRKIFILLNIKNDWQSPTDNSSYRPCHKTFFRSELCFTVNTKNHLRCV